MADTQTGWNQEFPKGAGRYYARHKDRKNAVPALIEIGSGGIYLMGTSSTRLGSDAFTEYEFLGPFTAKDFEQLLRLRQIAERALKAMSYPRHKDTATLMERIADEIDSKAAEGWTSFTTPHLRRAANDIREAANDLRSVLPEK